MPHAFASKAAEIKALKNKLSIATYEAVFSRTLEGRQQATADAITLQKELDQRMTAVFDEAHQVTDFVRSPSRGFLDTLDQFIYLVENPPGPAMTANNGPCTAMPSPR